jgi:hypothetical protein
MYDTTHKANYLSIDTSSLKEFDSYTGPEFIRDMVVWQRGQHFGGIMTFTLEYDFVQGGAGDAAFPLATAINDALSSTIKKRSGQITSQ